MLSTLLTTHRKVAFNVACGGILKHLGEGATPPSERPRLFGHCPGSFFCLALSTKLPPSYYVISYFPPNQESFFLFLPLSNCTTHLSSLGPGVVRTISKRKQLSTEMPLCGQAAWGCALVSPSSPGQCNAVPCGW